MSSQTQDLHRALLRPFVVHTLRAQGFHSTKPSVLDTVINLAERYLILLASTTAKQALNSHNDPVPTLTDVRMAMQDCGVLTPLESSAEEEWTELIRRPIEDLGHIEKGGRQRMQAEKRKREEEDVGDMRKFLRWFNEDQYQEIKRVAGMAPDAGAAVGVGGGVVHAEDFLSALKKRHVKGGDDSRLQGFVLGSQEEERSVGIEGGPVMRVGDWEPRGREEVGGVVEEEDTLR